MYKYFCMCGCKFIRKRDKNEHLESMKEYNDGSYHEIFKTHPIHKSDPLISSACNVLSRFCWYMVFYIWIAGQPFMTKANASLTICHIICLFGLAWLNSRKENDGL